MNSEIQGESNPGGTDDKIHETPHPSFSEAFRFWLKLGFISFGGPAGQIAIMYQELVEKKNWISDARFLNALNYCMLLPGPEAQQLATYIGWLLHKIRGGVTAGALFVIPSMFVLFILSYTYAAFGKIMWVASIFDGFKAVVMAIVVTAVIRIGKKALKNSAMISIAAVSFAAIFFLKLPFPVIILGAGLIGLAGNCLYPEQFNVIKEKGSEHSEQDYVVICPDESQCHIYPSWKRSLILIMVFALLWMLPILVLYSYTAAAVFFTQGIFFTKAALVTFGGAYAVLAYIAQAGVERYAWLTTPQMMDGLGLAETTPGPLIMVVQFVGFMGGWNHPGTLSPFMGGLIGSLVATYFTFLPCFMFIFLGSPYIEKFRGNRKLSAALSSITAAVVGVVFNLAIWFGMHVLFSAGGGINWFAAGLGLAAFAAMQWAKLGIITAILASGLLSLVRYLVF